MKSIFRILSLVCMMAIGQSLSAQDVIIFRTGDEVNANVTEVGIAEVKYTRTDNPAGPVYTVRKDDVFMIKYPNGVKDVFTISAPPAPQALNNNNTTIGNQGSTVKTISDYNKYMGIYQRRRTGGIVCTSIGVPFVVLGISLIAGGSSINNQRSYSYYNNGYYYDNYNNEGDGMIVAGSLILAAGIPLSIIGAVKLGTSHKYLRKANEAKATLSFAPSVEPIKPVGNIGGNQMGLAMRVTF